MEEKMERRLAVLFATWFGSGLILPVWGKGMAGSIAALPLCVPLVWLCWANPVIGFWTYVLVAAGLVAFGLWSIPIAEQALGPMNDWHGQAKTRDQNQIVIDEVLGMLVASAPIAVFHPAHYWWAFAAAVAAFWLCDIFKPWPVSRLGTWQSPWGVLLDDAAAGAWTPVAVLAFFALAYIT